MIRLTIENPGKGHEVEYHRNFRISGGILRGEGASDEIPFDAVLRVEVRDIAGKLLRYAVSQRKNDSRIFLEYPDLTTYPEADDPGKKKLLAYGFPELMVKDLSDPYASLRDATNKAWFNDDSYQALIVSATDRDHGLLLDDGIGYDNGFGEPYTALPVGDYRMIVRLSLPSGQLLAETTEDLHIIRQKEERLICRFHPVSHKERVVRWAEEQGVTVNPDTLPGYLEPYLGKWDHHMGLLPMYRANDLAAYPGARVRFFSYQIEEDSTSYETELPYLQKTGVVGDPGRFTAWRYEYGEPSIGRGEDERISRIVPFAENETAALCRIDLVDREAEDGTYDLERSHVFLSFPADGRLSVRAGERLAFMTVVRPVEQDPADFILRPDNVYENRDPVTAIEYRFKNGNKETVVRRPVGLVRTEGGKPWKKSVFEAYHIFDVDEELNGTLTVKAVRRSQL